MTKLMVTFPKFANATETWFFKNYYLNKFCVLIRNQRNTIKYKQ
jgi:hypothetical protein